MLLRFLPVFILESQALWLLVLEPTPDGQARAPAKKVTLQGLNLGLAQTEVAQTMGGIALPLKPPCLHSPAA